MGRRSHSVFSEFVSNPSPPPRPRIGNYLTFKFINLHFSCLCLHACSLFFKRDYWFELNKGTLLFPPLRSSSLSSLNYSIIFGDKISNDLEFMTMAKKMAKDPQKIAWLFAQLSRSAALAQCSRLRNQASDATVYAGETRCLVRTGASIRMRYSVRELISHRVTCG